jgi:hypothetical protein
VAANPSGAVQYLRRACSDEPSTGCWELAATYGEAGASQEAAQLYRRLCTREWRHVCGEKVPDLSNDGLRCCDAAEMLVLGRAPAVGGMQLIECRKRAQANESLERVRETLVHILRDDFPAECSAR